MVLVYKIDPQIIRANLRAHGIPESDINTLVRVFSTVSRPYNQSLGAYLRFKKGLVSAYHPSPKTRVRRALILKKRENDLVNILNKSFPKNINTNAVRSISRFALNRNPRTGKK